GACKRLQALGERGVAPSRRGVDGAEPIGGFRERIREGEMVPVRAAGRVMAIRNFGKAAFLDVKDRTGRIQVYFKKDAIGDAAYEVYQLLDLGDVIGVEGDLGKTRTGEPTVFAKSFQLLTKSLQPLPAKWHGLKDVEIRYRKRYLDLISSEDVQKIFLRRADVIREVRAFLDGRGFIEVETPVLHSIAGGATARPFVTH